MGRVILAVGALAAAVVAAGLVQRHDPASTLLFPPCPFHWLTGLHCPGCGSLRALHALLNGELTRALRFNALTLAAAPLLIGGVAREAVRIVSGHDPWPVRAPAWTIWSLAALIVAFGILRNLPALAWLAPG